VVIKALVISVLFFAAGCSDQVTLDCSSELAAFKSVDQIKKSMSESQWKQISDAIQRTASKQILHHIAKSMPAAMSGEYQATSSDITTTLAPLCGMTGDEILAYDKANHR